MSNIDFSEYELEPPPTDAMPREFVLWCTGRNFEELRNPTTGIDFTWEELNRIGADQLVTRLIQLSAGPIRLRKKSI